MLVEHITLGGDTAHRETDGIFQETIDFFRPFQITNGVFQGPVPHTKFVLKITAVQEGAIFDIMKGNDIAITCCCCFDGENTNSMLEHVTRLSKIYPNVDSFRPRLPVLDNWIYSVVINGSILKMHEQIIAGEIELYIYHALWLARVES